MLFIYGLYEHKNDCAGNFPGVYFQLQYTDDASNGDGAPRIEYDLHKMMFIIQEHTQNIILWPFGIFWLDIWALHTRLVAVFIMRWDLMRRNGGKFNYCGLVNDWGIYTMKDGHIYLRDNKCIAASVNILLLEGISIIWEFIVRSKI